MPKAFSLSSFLCQDNQEIARKYHFKIMEVRASDDRMQGLQRIAQEIIQQG